LRSGAFAWPNLLDVPNIGVNCAKELD